jgi:hypothetical protein
MRDFVGDEMSTFMSFRSIFTATKPDRVAQRECSRLQPLGSSCRAIVVNHSQTTKRTTKAALKMRTYAPFERTAR